MREGRASVPHARSNRRRWQRVAAAVALGTSVASCSLGTALDGYSGGRGSDPDGPDATSGEAGGEVGSDTGPAIDAAKDGGTDGGAQRWCEQQSPQPKICEDFDEPGEFALAWTRSADPNSTLTRQNDAGRSASNALLAATSGASAEEAFLRRAPGGTFRKLHTAFDVRIDKRGGYAEIGYIAIKRSGPSPATAYFYLQVRVPGYPVTLVAPSVLSDGGFGETSVSLGGNVSFDAWTRVDVVIDYTMPRTATIRIDGSPAATLPLDANLFTPDSFELSIGTGFAPGDGQTWRILYDNFTADWE